MLNIVSKLSKEHGFAIDKQFNIYHENTKRKKEWLLYNYALKKSNKMDNFEKLLNHLIGLAKRVKKRKFYSITDDSRVLMNINIEPNKLLINLAEGNEQEQQLNANFIITIGQKIALSTEKPLVTDFAKNIFILLNEIIQAFDTSNGKAKVHIATVIFEAKRKAFEEEFGVEFKRGQLAIKYANNYLELLSECFRAYIKVVGKENLMLSNVTMVKRTAEGGFTRNVQGTFCYMTLNSYNLDPATLGEKYEEVKKSVKDTIYHELGHLMDNIALHRCSVEQHDTYLALIKEVYKDDNIDRMVNVQVISVYREPASLKTYNAFTKMKKGRLSHLEYLLSKNEVVARGIAQWFMLREYGTCYRTKDFKHLDNMESMNKSIAFILGLIKSKNNKIYNRVSVA